MNAKEPFGYLLNHSQAEPTRRLIVLGASGSVGGTCLAYAKKCPAIEIAAVSVHGSVSMLRESLFDFPTIRFAAISNEVAFDDSIESLRSDYPRVKFFCGPAGLIELIDAAHADGADTVLTAVVGAVGIQATMRAFELGCKVALANKETMVTAGPAIEAMLIRQQMRDDRPSILPVDSEHNAVFQLLGGLHRDHVKRVILTASGGPFRDMEPSAIASVTRDQVLNHPTWSMGPKITVDSAGMINKGLELIEARYLFSVSYDQLGVLVHRHSLVHGAIETVDGAYLFCASQPHMVFPVAHALHYPDPVPEAHEMATPPPAWVPLEFSDVSAERYPGFQLCFDAGRRGGTAPALLNAANEIAVAAFLEDRIRFSQIPAVIADVLDRIPVQDGTDLELFLEADRQARELARECSTRHA